MNFTFLTATAEANVGTGTSSISFIVVMVVMIAVLYLVMYRPQKKKEKQAQEKRNSIEIGDEITTIGGIVGRVVSLKEDNFVLETAGERSRLRFKRWAIQEVSKLELDASTDAESDLVDTNKSEKK